MSDVDLTGKKPAILCKTMSSMLSTLEVLNLIPSDYNLFVVGEGGYIRSGGCRLQVHHLPLEAISNFDFCGITQMYVTGLVTLHNEVVSTLEKQGVKVLNGLPARSLLAA